MAEHYFAHANQADNICKSLLIDNLVAPCVEEERKRERERERETERQTETVTSK